MIEKLGNLVSLRAGVTFRSRVVDNPTAPHHLFQFRDIDRETHQIVGATRIDGSAFHKRHFLKEGDILFTAKGSPNKAIVYTEQDQQLYPKALALSIFTVIQVTSPHLHPEYLAWYLNSPIGQKAMDGLKMGTVIPNISSSSLKQLPISLPPLEKQISIAQVIQLLEQEEALHLALIREKKRLVHQAICEEMQ